MRLVRACLLLTAGLSMSACWLPGHPIGAELRAKTQFESECKDYLEFSKSKCKSKALAVAGDLRGVYVSGLYCGEANEKDAKEIAMQRCRERRADRKIELPCRLYPVGDSMSPPP